MHHHTAQIQSPRSMVMRGVTLQYTVRSQQPFIRNFAQAFKGILKINMNSYCIKKGYIFIFAAKSLDKKKFTPCSMILRRVSFFYTKIQISQRKQTKDKNILSHWSVAQTGLNYEKTGG